MTPTRRKRILLGALIAVPIVLIGGAFLAAEATRSNAFCGQRCHEMWPYGKTWQASSHDKADCVRCHIPPGLWNYAKTKFFALRELYVHIMGQVKKPVTVTRHIPNVVCLGCHPADRTSARVTLAKWTKGFSHRGHAKVPLCIDCHAQVVHEPIAGVPYVPAKSMKACFSCHDGKTQPNACTYCHSSPHPNRGRCQDCHSLKSWTNDFRHPVPLVGRHREILCERCHTQATPTKMGFAAGCIGCHKPPHPLRLGSQDLRECAKCHTITHWYPTTFKHPKSNCLRCHTAGPLHGGLTNCLQCHTQRSWMPTTFVHRQVGEHVPSGEVRLACTSCHKTTYTVATCTPCHGPGGPGGG